MIRLAPCAVAGCLLLAAPASADPLPIRHDRAAVALALAGPDVVVMSEHVNGPLKLVAVPRTGGRARTLLSVPDAAIGHDPADLASSPQRVAAIVEVDKTKHHPHEWRVYSGPPSGPLKLVRDTPDPTDEAWEPFAVGVDGDRMLLLEGIPTSTDDDGDEEPQDAGPVRASILDSSGWTPVPWTSGQRVPIAIAGPFAAVTGYAPQRLEVADLASGAPVATLAGPWQITETGIPFDLRADGMLAEATRTGIELAGPTQAPATLPGSGKLSFPTFAGTGLVAFDDARNTLDVIGAGGKTTTLGPPSMIRSAVDGDADGVAWLFNGCVRYASLTRNLKAHGHGPCPGSELALWTIGPSSKLHGSTATVSIKCVASITGRCKGRLVVRSDIGKPIIGRGSFDIAATGRWVKTRVHVNAATVAAVHRHGWTGVVVNAIMRDGSVGSGADYSSEFEIKKA
jgi:hypothetical protein